jgi:hypothetical protein
MTPSRLLGAADVRILQDDGWCFRDRGVQMADCYAVWSARGDDRELRFLACPERFPEMWPEPPNGPSKTT